MAVSILEALDSIATKITPLSSEMIPIEQAVGRVASEAYRADFDLPRFDNSAMDGYVVKLVDAQKEVRESATIYAGDDANMRLQEGEAIKIMTGAPIPQGGEAIVPIEHVSKKGDKILLPEGLRANQFIRKQGEDIKRGRCFLEKGMVINAYMVAALASQGKTHLRVVRKIKVAIFGTGDELRPHFEKIESHQLYNSNSPMFLTRTQALGCDVRFIPASADTLEALEASIRSTLDADMILTSGGVSVGDKDFTKEAFHTLGMQTYIDTIEIKPGRPTIIGKLENTIVVNLPGNPLASMVNYELFVRAIIRRLSGSSAIYHRTITTVMKEDFVSKGGKYAVILGKFDGRSFAPLKVQMPGMVSPMYEADGCILIRPECKQIKQGETVKMIPIAWEFCSTIKEEIFTK